MANTIDLTDRVQQQTGKSIGVSDVSMGQADNTSKKATVVLAEQHSISKSLSEPFVDPRP